MSLGRVEAWVLAASIVLAGFWFGRSRSSERPEETPGEPARQIPALAALPRGAALVVSADFARVRQSPLGAALTGGGRELPGIGPLDELCGFDPTDRIREIALAAADGASELGIVATGDFSRDRLIECAARVIEKRGGEPAHSQLGSFRTVRDRGRPEGEVAVREGGPVLLGGGSYLRDMVDAVEGRAPTLLGDETHSVLRAAIGGRGAVLVTWIARPDWLERWLGHDAVAGSPLAAVRAGALRLEVAPELAATFLFTCPDDATCQKLGAWAEGLCDGLRQAARESAGEDPVRESKVTVEKNVVRLSASLDSASASKLLVRWFLRDEPAPAGSLQPDEILRSSRD
jgi:hypothetical protein